MDASRARRARRPGVLTLLPALLATVAGGWPALAHDLWIEPSRFACAVGDRIAVRLRVGQQFQGDPFPRDPRYLARFSAVDEGGREVPIPGVPGTDPAGFFSPVAPGSLLLIYASHHASAELDAVKFEKYLADEGLEQVSAARARRGQSGAPGKELYSRCAKSLIRVGGGAVPGPGTPNQVGAAAVWQRLVGLSLELVPERDPTTLAPGQTLPVRLLYHGQPLAGAKVVGLRRATPGALPASPASPSTPAMTSIGAIGAASGRTDRKGRAELPLALPGVWLVKAVHMIAAPPGSGADWESFWASLTFELR